MKRFYRFFLVLFIVVFIAGCSKTKQKPEGTGMQFTDTATLNKVNNGKAPLIGSSKMPASVDLSSKMPPPGNQGSQNSCVGWSIAYGMKSYNEKTARNWELTSGNEINEQHVFSPAYIYNQINHGQDNGSKFTDAFNLLQTKGVASLSKDPYDDKDYLSKPSEDANTEAKNFKIAWSKKVDPKDVEGLKSYLSKGYPIIIAISFDQSFFDKNGPAVVNTMEVNATMGHAMLVVGFDDGKKAFKIMNSWGSDWREGGFCWFTYDIFKTITREAWIAKDEEDKKEIKTTDEPQVNDENPVVDEVLSDITVKDVDVNSTNPESHEDGKCLKITGTMKLDKNFGDNAQVVVFLNYADGKPVLAANDNYAYYNGGAAGFTSVINLENYDEKTETFTIYIPYSALKIDNAGNIFATPVLYIDDFDATDGKAFSFNISN